MPTFDALADDFNDGTLDTSLWSGSYGDPDEVGGHARIPCTTGYAGLKSGSSYTLTGAGITIRLYAPAPDGATSAAASCLVLSSVGGSDAGFIVDAAQSAVGLYLREGYADGGAVFLTYSATDHAWLRFRETAGTLYWDTSPDGIAWTNWRTAATPAWAADANLAFLIEGHRDAGTNDFAEVDSVNVSPITTVTGSATLTASGTATATGILRAAAASTLTANATVTAVGIRRTLGVSSLTAAGTATALGRLRARGQSSLAVAASLTAAGTRRATGTVTASSACTLAATGKRTARGSATLTARGIATVAAAAVDYSITVGSPYLTWEVGNPWL
jgi:hypothetical protein